MFNEIKNKCIEYLDGDCVDKDCYMCRRWGGCKLVGYKEIIIELEVNGLISESDTKMIKKIKNINEDEAQAYICSWCLQNNLIPCAITNGVNLGGFISLFKKHGLPVGEMKAVNAKQIALLKKEGLLTGMPDLMIFGFTNEKIPLLFMENKVKNNSPSEIQKATHDWLRSLGFTVQVSKNSIDAIQKIKCYFGQESQPANAEYMVTRKHILTKKKEVFI